jgi:hypothetical protein
MGFLQVSKVGYKVKRLVFLSLSHFKPFALNPQVQDAAAWVDVVVQ